MATVTSFLGLEAISGQSYPWQLFQPPQPPSSRWAHKNLLLVILLIFQPKWTPKLEARKTPEATHKPAEGLYINEIFHKRSETPTNDYIFPQRPK